MKAINILALILVILNSIGIIYIKYLDYQINKKVDEMDNAIFEHMKDEHNSKIVNKEE